MLNKTFIPGNILTANELNDIVDGLNNVDVRIGEQFQCCCDEEIKPVLLSHIYNEDIHTPIQEITDLIERKIQTALEGWSGPIIPDNPTDLTDYVKYKNLTAILAEYWKKADIQSELDKYVFNDVFTETVKDIYNKINGIVIPDNLPSYSDIEGLEDRLETLSGVVTANKTKADSKHTELQNQINNKADKDSVTDLRSYVDAELKKIPSNDVKISYIKDSNLDQYNPIRIGEIIKNGESVGTIYAPVAINTGDGDKPGPSTVLQEHQVTLYTNNEYNEALRKSLYNQNNVPYGSYYFETKTFVIGNLSPIWTENLSSLKRENPIYFTTRVFYSDDTSSNWTVPALFVDRESFPSSAYVQIYAKEDEDGNIPTLGDSDGDYNFKEGKFVAPTNWAWTTSLSSFDLSKDKIYYTWRTFYSNKESKWYKPPVRMITKEQLEKEISSNYTTSTGVALYKAVDSGVTKVTKPNTKELTIYYNNNKDFTKPEDWSYTVSDAINKNSNKNDSVVYVSFNNFLFTKKESEIISVKLGEWTDPIKWIDIDSILKDADDRADALSRDAEDRAVLTMKAAQALLEKRVGQLEGDFVNIVGANGETISAAINGIKKFYSWKKFGSHSDITAYEPKLTMIQTWEDTDFYKKNNRGPVNYNELNTIQDLKFVNYWTVLGSPGKYEYYAYVAESLAIVSQVASIKDGLKTVQEYLDDTEWVVQAVTQNIDNDDLNTALVRVMSNNINLVVSNPEGNGAVIDLSIKGKDSNTTISSTEIVLNGNTIAEAISAKELNINDVSIIKENGDVLLSQGTSGSSNFLTDGSGQLAGGLIRWGTNVSDITPTGFALKIRGHIEATSGFIGPNKETGWTIGTVDNTPAIVGANSGGDQLVLSTNYLAQKNGNSYSWMLNRDGSAVFGDPETNRFIDLSDGNLVVSGEIQSDYGKIGGWNIGKVGNVPCLYSEHTESSQGIYFDDKIVISPQEMYSEVGNVKKWQLSRDGSGQVANGNINWDEHGNASFKGNIHANSGFFKGDVYATDGVFNGTVNATSGTFTGDIKAKTLQVVNEENITIMILSEWTEEDDDAHPDENIPVGAPVIKTSYGGCDYFIPIHILRSNNSEQLLESINNVFADKYVIDSNGNLIYTNTHVVQKVLSNGDIKYKSDITSGYIVEDIYAPVKVGNSNSEGCDYVAILKSKIFKKINITPTSYAETGDNFYIIPNISKTATDMDTRFTVSPGYKYAKVITGDKVVNTVGGYVTIITKNVDYYLETSSPQSAVETNKNVADFDW